MSIVAATTTVPGIYGLSGSAAWAAISGGWRRADQAAA